MGFDTHPVFILFGVKIPVEDIFRVIKIFFPDIDEVKRSFKIPDTTYHIVNNSDYFIALKSIRVGWDDRDESPKEIISPTQGEVTAFLEFLNQNEINYPYSQYFLF